MSPDAIEKLKNIYPCGTRVYLVSKDTKPSVMSASKGTVERVDENGLVLVSWDNTNPTTLDIRKDLFYKL